jgi:hypothetical protein
MEPAGGETKMSSILLQPLVRMAMVMIVRPLFIAASQGCDWETVQLLMGRGANTEELDKEGRTPLDNVLECARGGHDVVYLLLHAAGDRPLFLSKAITWKKQVG